MNVVRTIKNIFAISDLRRKLSFTLGVLVIHRLGCHIPVIGINTAKLAETIAQSGVFGKLLTYLDIFSGGALSQCTVFALGISPYITASIMMQILSFTVPELEALMKEGEYGKKIINQYTKYLALALSIVYSLGFAFALESKGLVLTPGIGFKLFFVMSLSVGCMIVMWLGDQVSLFGLGNGSSVIIFSGIVSRFPGYVLRTITYVQDGIFYHGSLPGINALIGIGLWAALIAIMIAIIYLEKGERKISVQYARRIIGNRVYGGQGSFIPFKINSVGVMPVILASAFLQMPKALFGFLSDKFNFCRIVSEALVQTTFVYNVLEFVLIVAFYYVYTALIFNPTELADSLKKNGGFIPGIRPGRKTAEFFDMILTRLGLVGSMYLAGLALLPNVMMFIVGMERMPFYLGGTSLLIVVGVALEMGFQIEAYLLEHNYEGFLMSGRLKSRGAR